MPETAVKAWVVSSDDRDKSVVRFNRTRSQARSEGASEMEAEFIEVRVRRAPEFDSYCPGPVPVAALMKAGWYMYCQYCQRPTYDDEPGMIIEPCDGQSETVYCSPECQAKYAEFRKSPLGPAYAR